MNNEYSRRLEKSFIDKIELFRKNGIIPKTLCPIEKKGKIILHVDMPRFIILGDEYFDELWHDFYKLIPYKDGRLMEGMSGELLGKKFGFLLNSENIFDIVWL